MYMSTAISRGRYNNDLIIVSDITRQEPIQLKVLLSE